MQTTAETIDMPRAAGADPALTGGRGCALLASGDLGSRLVHLARVAVALHTSQAAGLLAAAAEARGAGGDRGERA